MQVGLSLGAGAPPGPAPAPRPVIGLAGPLRISRAASTGRFVLDPVVVQGPASWDFAYQWERDFVSILGATESDYAPVAEDTGTQIRLRLQVFSPGYIPLAAYSNALSPAAASWTIEQTMILSAPVAPSAPRVSGLIVEL